MGAITTLANSTYRDYVIDGNPASLANRPRKSDVRALFAAVDAFSNADRTGTLGAARATLQAEINALIANPNGGRLRLKEGTYDTTGNIVIADFSAISTAFAGRIIIEGEGCGAIIRNTSGACFKFLGHTTNIEAYFELRNIRFEGNATPVASSVGVELNRGAYIELDNVIIRKFDVGLKATDVDQIGIYDSEIRFNNGNVLINAAGSVTDPNSWTWVNCCVGNAPIYGIQASNINAWTWIGGTIQYNGVIGGGAGQYGAFFSDTGSGYGTILFSGMIFEGNGGEADIVLQQVSAGADHCNVTFDTVSFMRTLNFVTVGYATNQVKIIGTIGDANYAFIDCNFYGKAGYVASAGRPALAITNANAKVEIDGLTKFWSATEAPTSSALYTGYAGSRDGSIKFGQAAGGLGTLSPPTSANSFTWMLPAANTTLIGADTTKTLTNTAFDTAGTGNSLSINGTAVTAKTGTGSVVLSASPALTGTMTIPSIAGGSGAAAQLVMASSTSGAPSGDKASLLASTVQIGGITGLPNLVNVGASVTPDTLLTVNSNAGATVSPSSAQVHLIAADASLGGIVADTFGAPGNQGVYTARHAGGTLAAKTAVAAGHTTFSVAAQGWDTVGFSTYATIDFITGANTQSPTDHGGGARIRGVPAGSTTLGEIIRFHGSTGVSVASATDPGIGNLSVSNALQVGSFTVAGLPSGVTGRTVFCSNCRMLQSGGTVEGAGSGTGGYVTYNGTAWKVAGTNVTASS
jgi:hypothetical protein